MNGSGRVRGAGRFNRKRELAKAQPDLGKVSDHVISERLGISRYCIQQAREELGIPTYQRPDPFRELREEIYSQDDLGMVPDAVIAKRLGVSADAVRKARYRRDIPSFATAKNSPRARNSPGMNNRLLRTWGRP